MATQAEIDAILDTVLQHEGGFQSNPNDKGNFHSGVNMGTNKGITPAAYEAYFNKKPSRKIMMNLTEKEARKIYQKNYITPVIMNLAPSKETLPHIVDMVINHGYANVVPIVQRAAGVKVDGKAGPATRRAMQSTPDFETKLVDERKAFYQSITKSNPKYQTFLKGWLSRAESYRPDPVLPPEVTPNPVAP
jgi:lysozyme family protein